MAGWTSPMSPGDYSIAPPTGAYGSLEGLQMPGQQQQYNFGALGQQNQQPGFGFNMPTIGQGLSGLATVGQLWNAWQSQKLAREQFNYTKSITDTNINNQIKSYNTTLSDRSRSRAVLEGQSAEQAQAYVDQNKMVR